MSKTEQAMVAPADFSSYYGRPILKPPRWQSPHMPAYLFLGGLSGASSTMAALADATGNTRLANTGKVTAAIAGSAGAALLIDELGRPERFLNMLRMFKPTSPMSVGSWILAAQGGFTMAAAASALTGIAPRLGRAAGAASALTGPMVATYTGALIADTAVPAWHAARRQLPFLFAGSALASAGAVAMLTTPRADAAPARRMALIGAAIETTAALSLEQGQAFGPAPKLVAEPYRTNKSGTLLRTARALTFIGAAGILAAPRSRTASTLSSTALIAAALCTRFGIYHAGVASAKDPKYTVTPQRST